MEHGIALGLVVLVALAGLFVGLSESPSGGAFHFNHGMWEQRIINNASAPYGPLQKPRQLYQDAFHRCRAEAMTDIQRCDEKFERDSAIYCAPTGPCKSYHDRNNCYMHALIVRGNCDRFRRNVMHDLSYGDYFYGNVTVED